MRVARLDEVNARYGTEYLSQLPESIPAGRYLVHNHVYPVSRRPGTRGFRVWLATSDERLEPCDCGWAPELGRHFRVTRKDGA